MTESEQSEGQSDTDSDTQNWELEEWTTTEDGKHIEYDFNWKGIGFHPDSHEDNLEKLESILSKSTTLEELDDYENTTILVFAMMQGHYYMAKYLIAKGANINYVCNANYEKARVIEFCKSLHMLKYFVDHGAIVPRLLRTEPGVSRCRLNSVCLVDTEASCEMCDYYWDTESKQCARYEVLLKGLLYNKQCGLEVMEYLMQCAS